MRRDSEEGLRHTVRRDSEEGLRHTVRRDSVEELVLMPNFLVTKQSKLGEFRCIV